MDLLTIQKRLTQIDQLEQQNRASREMLKSELESDPVYVQAVEETRASNVKKKQIKDAILGRGPNEKLVTEIKENLEEITTLKEILSAELVQVWEESKQEEIEDQNGALRKFKLMVKLLPKKGKFGDRDDYGKYAKDDGLAE
ncbi:MAG: hypothetical protein WCT32_04415 [Patescibacteria group bacterium]